MSKSATTPTDLQALFDSLLDRERLQTLTVGADGFAFDPRSGQTFSVNETGVLALGLMRDTSSLERSIAGLSHRFDVPYAVARGSFEVFVRQLSHYLG